MMRTIKMRLRFMKLLSWDRRLSCRYDCDIGTRCQTRPEQVECSLDARMQGGITMERPNQERAKDRLAKNVSDLRGGEVVADFAAFLPEVNHLGMKGMGSLMRRAVLIASSNLLSCISPKASRIWSLLGK